MLYNLPYIAAALIGLIGLFTILTKRNLVKVLLGLTLFESSVNLFLIMLGYREGGVAPIYTSAPSTFMVLPTVQALTLTSIVIGVATSALLLSFAILVYRWYGTVDASKMRRLRG
ncbi:MAG TPA: cation:proton antiporter subunit C [Methanomicrobiales archaeon]|nr:cation:proton antiporter subunit C [Methanomicrobiales archaeon]